MQFISQPESLIGYFILFAQVSSLEAMDYVIRPVIVCMTTVLPLQTNKFFSNEKHYVEDALNKAHHKFTHGNIDRESKSLSEMPGYSIGSVNRKQTGMESPFFCSPGS